MAKCKHHDALLGLLLQEQFVTTRSIKLGLFPSNRVPKDIKDMVELTERYLEAHGGSISSKYRTNPPKPKSPSDQKADSGIKDMKDQDQKENRCFLCHKKELLPEYKSTENRNGKTIQKAVAASCKTPANKPHPQKNPTKNNNKTKHK